MLLIVAGLLAIKIGHQYRDPFYGFVIVWASIAIAIKQSDLYPQLGYVAWGVAMIILIYAAYLIGARLIQGQRRIVT